jgi:hypothetical protein
VRLTLKHLREATKDLPGDLIVRGYEGEGGSWVIVEQPHKFCETVIEFNTDYEEDFF